MYGSPKIHKEGNPLRPIVDYAQTIAYKLSRDLADILQPLVGKTKYHVENSKDLVNELKSVKLENDEIMISYDVVSLFTKTPIHGACQVIKRRLEKDNTLKKRTNLLVEDVMRLLEFVLETTYFKCGGLYYQQKFGVAMGSPVSPIIVNLYMEDLEQNIISKAPVMCKPKLWKRYVDDILCIIKKDQPEALQDHMNRADGTGSIKFTKEEEADGCIPFLDVLIERKEDGSLKSTVYRKKTH
jgi:hypothetical protein